PVPCGQSQRARVQPDAAPANRCSSVLRPSRRSQLPDMTAARTYLPQWLVHVSPFSRRFRLNAALINPMLERLREVAQRPPARSGLLGVQPQVIDCSRGNSPLPTKTPM